MAVFGVDEAGKGPVLGSMFAAAVRAEPAALPPGVDDSKNLTRERREELARRLRADDDVAVGVSEIAPARIDDPETDMNTLTVLAHAAALDRVAVAGDEGIVDAGDTNAVRFGHRVTDAAETDVEVRAEHGADEAHALVGAASIIAKVERDAHVARLAEAHDADLGSGYPSDPTTRTFLEEYVATHDELPDCARESWQTCRDVLAARVQTGLDEFQA